MKSLIKKSLWILFLVIQSTFMYAQSNSVKGTVIDENGETLPGVTVVEKGTSNGTTTEVDGTYSLNLKAPNAVLAFSFTGYKNAELAANNAIVNLQMEVDVASLDEVVVTGVRGAQLREVALTRDEATVMEAITPEDNGSFSDANVADALQRVAEVQIERNVDGVSGDRASIRGIGPQFVRVTINGRIPISAGNEGRSDFRKFNLNVIPSEITSGARIKKTGQAKEVATGLGGTINFQTIRPLDKRYKNEKKYFASINLRESSNSEFKEIDFDHRISGVFGYKINDKLAAAISVMYRDEVRRREEAGLRGYRILDFREDTNEDGVFNVDDGDRLYEGMLVPATINNQFVIDHREQIALATAIQFRPIEKLDIVLDFSTTRLKNNSDRQFFQMSLSSGGNNGLYGQTDDNFFSPGSLEFNGNNFQYISAAGASLSRVNLQNRNTLFDNHTTNNIGGINAKYEATDKLTLHFDVSYSDLNFFQDLKLAGGSRLDGRDYDQSTFSLDVRGERPFYTLPDEIFDPTAFQLLSSTIRHIRTLGKNYGAKIDADYKLNKNMVLSVGGIMNNTAIETREAGASSNSFGGFTEEQKAEYIEIRSGEDNLTPEGFLNGDIGLSQWLSTPGQAALDLNPYFASLDGGRVFDFDTPLKDVMSQDSNLVLNTGRSFDVYETRIASYVQLDVATKLFNVPLFINVGVRGVQSINGGSAFTGVNQFDPITDTRSSINGALYHEIEGSRFDLLPSFNARFKIRENLNYRFNVSRGAIAPRFTDMVPRNAILFLDPASEIFDPNSPEYIDDLSTSTYRGTVTTANPDLKPYSAWMFDNTVDFYSKNGGVIKASIFYKALRNYVGRRILNDQPYPGEERLGIALPEGQENLLFDISTPVNFTNARIFGFGIGFNQHFTFLPGFAKGFGLKANYTRVGSAFEGDFANDAENGLPGSSKHNFNATLYYQKYGFSLRFTIAKRSNYLSNLGGIGSTRADEAHYTNANTILGLNLRFKLLKKINISAGVANLTGEDTRRYIDDDPRNLTSYFVRNPLWKIGIRYGF